jgi:putative transposase
MGYTFIMVHAVWATKNREPPLSDDKRGTLFSHIKQNARSKNIYIDTIGGYTDHVHSLINLGSEQSIAKVVQLIKGESSFWSNKEGLIKPKLVWAADYFAASVSYSSIQKARDYINQQLEHHKQVSFNDEYEKFLRACGVDSAKAGFQ